MSEYKFTSENFENEVIKSDKPVLIDFYADWCGPCKMIAPVIEQVADELGDSVKVGKINVDEQPELAAQFGVASIPYLAVVENGKLVNQAVGFMPKEDILALLS